MKSLRTFCLIALAAAQICLSAACARTAKEPIPSAPPSLTSGIFSTDVPQTGGASPSVPQTTRPQTPQTSSPNGSQTAGPDFGQTTGPNLPPEPEKPPEPGGIPIFVQAVQNAYPKAISGQESQALLDDLERMLAGKSYSEVAKNLVRNTAVAILDGQAEFQSLFGFLKPHDTETYFRKYFLDPLDSMVDTLRCCGEECPDDLRWLHETYGEEPGFSGITDDIAKSIAIVMNDPTYDTVILAHEVYHAATLKEHFIGTTQFYLELIEGSATFYQLAMLGSGYTNLDQLNAGTRFYPDPDNPDYIIQFYGLNGMYYSGWSNKYFKLLALTDFDTMDLFLRPDGELDIRKNLAKRYGEEGERYYDLLESADSFSEVLDNEARFLRLFTSRMKEIDSQEDCVSYFQLYRLYRRVFAAKYVRSYTVDLGPDMGLEGHNFELSHPLLDYAACDRAMADTLLEFGVLNVGSLTKEEQGILAYALTANLTPRDDRETSAYWIALINEPITIARLRYSFEYTDGDPFVTVHHSGGNVYTVYYSMEEGILYYPI